MLIINSEKQTFAIEQKDNQWLLNQKLINVDMAPLGQDAFSLIVNGKNYLATIEQMDKIAKTVTVNINGNSYPLHISEPIDQLIKRMGIDTVQLRKAEAIKAPMPGMVLKILVHTGAEVKKGESLLILEAMKMENVLKASSDGRIKKIFVEELTAVEKGAVLIEME